MPIDDFKVQISGTVLGNNVSSDLKNQFKKIKDLSVTINKASLEQSAITDIKNSLASNHLKLQVDLGDTALKQQAQNVGRNTGAVISDIIQKTIKKSNGNKDFDISGETFQVLKDKFVQFQATASQSSLLGKNGALSTLFGPSQSPLTPELLGDYEAFKDLFNECNLSAEALAEGVGGNLNKEIVKYASGFKNGELTTNGFIKSLSNMTLGAKAAQVALNGLSIVGNMFVSWAITKGIQLAIVAFDNFIHSTEKAKEAAKNARQNFTTQKNELDDINTALGENSKRIQELQSKGSLTYVEATELDKLKKATKELKLQQDYKQRELKKAAEEKYEADTKAFKKEYGFGDFSSETVHRLANLTDSQYNDQSANFDDITLHAAMIEQYQNKLETALADGDKKAAEAARKTIKTHQEAIEEAIPTLGGYKDSIDELADYKNLKGKEIQFSDNVNSALKLAYTYVENGAETWNESILDDIFNTDGLEITKEKLIELAQAGTLDDATIASYENLNEAVQKSDFILSDSATSLTTFIDQLQILAAEENNSASSLGGIDLGNLNERIHSSIAAQNLFSTALSEQNEAGTISAETLAGLQKQYGDLGSVLEITSTGIQLNTQKLADLNVEERKNMRSEFSEKFSALKEHLNSTAYELAAYNQRLEQDTSLTEDQRNALESLIRSKETDRSTTLGQIADLKFLQTEYENSLSKYNAFTKALTSSDSGAHYDTFQSSLGKVQEMWNKGLTGTDDIRTFVDYMTNEDMSAASVEEISAAYQKAMADAKNYFTEGQEGSIRFANALKEIGMATEDANHKWSIDITDIDDTAQKLGYSVDFVKDNLQKLKDYGFDLNFSFDEDGNIDTTDALNGLNNQIDEIEEKIRNVAPGFDTSEWEAGLDELKASKKELEDIIQITIDKQKAVEEIQSLQEEIDKLTAAPDKSPTDQTYIAWAKNKQKELADANNITIEAVLNLNDAGGKTDSTIIDIANLEIEDKEFKVSADIAEATAVIDSLTNKDYTATVAVKLKTGSMFSLLQGIAVSAGRQKENVKNASWTGSAFVNGSWKVGYTGKALVGELGKELLVRNGMAIPIGTYGAEFVNLQANDIIFNHVQTKQLERNGRINSRGKAFFKGSVPAFNEESINNNSSYGNGGNTGGATASGIFYTPPESGCKAITNELTKAAGSSKKLTKEAEKQKKEYDWIKTALEYISGEREKIADTIENENVSYQRQLSLLDELLAADEQIIDTNKSALDIYKNQWNDVSAKILQNFGEVEGNSLLSKIMKGDVTPDGWKTSFEIDPDDESIDSKTELLDKALEIFASLSSQEDSYNKALAQITEDSRRQFEIRLNMIQASFEEVESAMNKLESELSLKETTGRMITEADYRELIRLSEDQIDLYYEQLDILQEELDGLKEGSAEWYNVKSKISGCSNAILQCEENQAKWNEEILNLPIRRIERYLALLNNIKKNITNKISEQDSLGIKATKEQLQSLIDISSLQIDKLREQHSLLSDKLGNYEYGSDKFNDVKNEIQDVEDEISSLIQSQQDWNKQILQIPLDNIGKLKEQLQNILGALTEVTDQLDASITAVTTAIEEQVGVINDLKDATTKEYEAKTKIEQDKLDLLQEQNKERGIQLALEQASYDLARANSQKANQVVRNGELVYEADQDAVRNANKSKADAEYNKTVYDLEEQIKALEDERDNLLENYDEQIEKLEEIKDKWSEIASNIEKARNASDADEILGPDWKDKILSGHGDDLYNMLKGNYENIAEQKDLYEKQIDSNDKIASLMEQYIAAYQDGSMSFSQVMSQFDSLIHSAKDGFSALENLEAILDIAGNKDADSALDDIQNGISSSLNDFKDYLKAANSNNNTIASYTSTWEEIKKVMEEQLATLKKLAEEEAKRVSDAKVPSGSGGKGHSSSKGPNWNTPDNTATGPGKESELRATAERTKEQKKNHYKDGIENGPVQRSPGTTVRMLKTLATQKLNQDEVAATLHTGEIVLNELQQQQLLRNLEQIPVALPFFAPPAITTDTAGKLQEFNFQTEINLNSVDNTQKLAEAFKRELEPALRQAYSKY